MLAVKFYHLRALIHRPHLCALWLRPNDASQPPIDHQHLQRVQESKLICIESAQETARLMHHVPDKKTLTEDYPWWQIISCMMCASSILLVASKFSSVLGLVDDTRRAVLDEEIETLLTVFDALSVNSQAARLARGMTVGLQSANRQGRPFNDAGARGGGELVPSEPSGTATQHQLPDSLVASFPAEPLTQTQRTTPQHQAVVALEGPMWSGEIGEQQWPFEFSDSILWSSQFVNLGNISDPTNGGPSSWSQP
jgi:hypothetical protein